MLLEHELYHGFGMDALIVGCTRNTNVIMVSAWVHWFSYALKHGKARYVDAAFWALEMLQICGSCHAGHIQRDRPSRHFFARSCSSGANNIILGADKKAISLNTSALNLQPQGPGAPSHKQLGNKQDPRSQKLVL